MEKFYAVRWMIEGSKNGSWSHQSPRGDLKQAKETMASVLSGNRCGPVEQVQLIEVDAKEMLVKVIK